MNQIKEITNEIYHQIESKKRPYSEISTSDFDPFPNNSKKMKIDELGTFKFCLNSISTAPVEQIPSNEDAQMDE